MKFLLIAFAIVGLAAAAQLPDSATQGPNPQDIATPEPEYIDIDLPEPPRPAAPAPAPKPVAQPIQRPVSAPVHQQQPIQSRFLGASSSSNSFAAPRPVVQQQQQQQQRSSVLSSYLPPLQLQQPQQLAGHTYNSQTGYQYRRPVFVRRVYRRRF